MFIAARAVVWPLLAAFFPLVCHDRFQKPNSQEHVKHVESQETDSHVMGMFLSIILKVRACTSSWYVCLLLVHPEDVCYLIPDYEFMIM